MTPEQRSIPDWAQKDHRRDREWITENLFIFWPAASTAFIKQGRGAIIVDITQQPIEGLGHPFGYFPQAWIEQRGEPDVKRMVREYDPDHELVIVMLKPLDHISTYRVQPQREENQPRNSQEFSIMNKEGPVRRYFTQAEAEAKVGRKIQTRVEFSGVPQGTLGQVISADQAGWAKPPIGHEAEVYDVAIQWDLPRREPFADLVIPVGSEEPYLHVQTGKPLVDWFTKDEYEQYLDELAIEHDDSKP